MQSMTLPGRQNARRYERTCAIGATVLVHVAVLGGLLLNAQHSDGLRAGDSSAHPLFTLVPLLVPSKAPARSAPAPATAQVATGGVAHAAPETAAPARVFPPARAIIEVVVPPPSATASLAQLPAMESAGVPAPIAAPVAAVASAPAVPDDGPVVMVPMPGGEGGVDGLDGRKTIIIESMGSSVGTYLFPGLAGVTANNETRQFRVELAEYPDLQTAVVNDIIRRLRAQFPNEIKWDSAVRGGIVTLSMRVEDHQALVRFLRAELFNPRRKTVIEAGNAVTLDPPARMR